LREGHDLTIISIGGRLNDSLKAASRLAALGIQARVLSLHTLKPMDKGSILAAAKETKIIVTVEEHSTIGGLGSAVAECILESDVRLRAFKRIGLNDAFAATVGDQEHLCRQHGIDGDGIAQAVRSLLLKRDPSHLTV
jgi:transketolase